MVLDNRPSQWRQDREGGCRRGRDAGRKSDRGEEGAASDPAGPQHGARRLGDGRDYTACDDDEPSRLDRLREARAERLADEAQRQSGAKPEDRRRQAKSDERLEPVSGGKQHDETYRRQQFGSVEDDQGRHASGRVPSG